MGSWGRGAETEETDIEIEINDIDNNNGLVYPTSFYDGNRPLLFFFFFFFFNPFAAVILTPSLL